jgi:predicted RNase H-like nuclease
MRYIGVDLAWAGRNPTGLAALDDRGNLVDMTSARTDDGIDAWLVSHADGACLVAIDAPIIVRNPTGQRPCEQLVSRYFAAYAASAHPTNTSRPYFAGGTRAQGLARRHGLDVDPASARRRRAIEVYPHPAIVMLFGLPRSIPYKNKTGRDLETLRTAQLRLRSLLEGLRTANPALRLDHAAWRATGASVAHAVTKATLRRTEDQVDAVVCAYVALVADTRAESVRVLGDVEQGYIVTPVTADMAGRMDADTTSPPARRV